MKKMKRFDRPSGAIDKISLWAAPEFGELMLEVIGCDSEVKL